MITSWTGAAEQFAGDAAELGGTVADTVAAAWRARCHPDATRSLVRAAIALTSDNARARLWADVPPSPSMDDLLTQTEELEAEAASLADHGKRMTANCEDALSQAAGEHQAARNRAGSADTQARMAETAQVIADCDAALELLAQVLNRLGYAVRCFRQVPADLEETYDVPLQYLRDGGTLPWSGDFLTGCSPEMITNGARR